MQTERFNRLRKSFLSKIFEKRTIIDTWRKIVRDQLRKLDIKDLYDHYDFNYNIEARALAIRSEILNGTYKTSQTLIYRIEKKFGICRHLIIPQPIDALVLQVLVENISDNILEKQPSTNAYYSRDKHNAFKPHEFDDYGMTWRQQWKELQKQIYNFNEEKDLIVVTDISNYYDSIDMKELRKVFTSYSQIDEVVADLLFRIVEEITWKPDYLPYSGRCLPTTTIEGIRLLAHSFLFEIDEVLKQKTNNSFTRWMDDIVIGVDTKSEAIETLSAVSDMLKTRGLALNLAKTNIYTDKEGFFHFQIANNRYIDSIENIKPDNPNYKKISSDLYKSFKSHFKEQEAKYWDKVAKRYITTLGKFQVKKLLNDIPKIYVDFPSLRPNLLLYLFKSGYSKKAADVVIEILKTIEIFDDLSLFQLCYLVTEWEIPVNDENKEFLENFEQLINSFSVKRKISSDFYCVLWFKAKYNHPDELLHFIQKFENIWQSDTFLRRQATAILSRLLKTNSKVVEKILFNQISSGITNTVTLGTQLLQFAELETLDQKLTYYLFPNKPQRPYPLSKFLVLCSILNSEKIRNDETVKAKIKHQIKDPYFLRWLDYQYNIN